MLVENFFFVCSIQVLIRRSVHRPRRFLIHELQIFHNFSRPLSSSEHGEKKLKSSETFSCGTSTKNFTRKFIENFRLFVIYEKVEADRMGYNFWCQNFTAVFAICPRILRHNKEPLLLLPANIQMKFRQRFRINICQGTRKEREVKSFSSSIILCSSHLPYDNISTAQWAWKIYILIMICVRHVCKVSTW